MAKVLLILVLPIVNGFYLPGVAPTSYVAGDKVPVHVNRLTPAFRTGDESFRSVLAFDYYDQNFGFCQPEGGPRSASKESLGSILFGDRIQTSPFEVFMLKNETCKLLCRHDYNEREAQFVNRRIGQTYNFNWLIDGLPAAMEFEEAVTNTDFYSPGFSLGMFNRDSNHPFAMLNNHYDIIIDYHQYQGMGNDKGSYRVVGVIVQPESRKESKETSDGRTDCESASDPLILSETARTPAAFTYSVYWRSSPTAWATRWDKYLHVFDPIIHWFSLITSTIIMIAVVMMVAGILVRALKKDIARYNRLDAFHLSDFAGTGALEEDAIQEDSGWKQLHGDVFRVPSHPMFLAILLGSGTQLYLMLGITIAFALLGFLSPSNRGSLSTIMIMLYTFLSLPGGYVSSRIYKTWEGERWKRNIILTPLLVPGSVFAVFFLLNILLWAKHSSGAVPLTTMLVIIGIWFLISLPLSATGSWLGFCAPVFESPVRTNQIPRQIPPSTLYMRPLPSMLLLGILPFGAIFIELLFIMRSIWFSKFYYMFGFLFISYGLLIITTMATTVLMTYFLLCSENYRWQWRAFGTGGAVAVWTFVLAMGYWLGKGMRGSGWVSGVLYLGYSLTGCLLILVLTGTVGFFASWAFVHRIYRSIKVD